jgi:hypothetical protein
MKLIVFISKIFHKNIFFIKSGINIWGGGSSLSNNKIEKLFVVKKEMEKKYL